MFFPLKKNKILGIGNDIIEIRRISSIINKYGKCFIDKIFSVEEQRYCSRYAKSHQHYAARFSAKEAIAKALGVGICGMLEWLDVEVSNDNMGAPYVKFSEKAMKNFKDPTVKISISHCRDFATAFAMWIS